MVWPPVSRRRAWGRTPFPRRWDRTSGSVRPVTQTGPDCGGVPRLRHEPLLRLGQLSRVLLVEAGRLSPVRSITIWIAMIVLLLEDGQNQSARAFRVSTTFPPERHALQRYRRGPGTLVLNQDFVRRDWRLAMTNVFVEPRPKGKPDGAQRTS